ncbi:zinc finger FYVE domain-containing protein 9-like [Lineus longissimus]|uniref:zinc finger FYVE domain-containing protein 9-like n=1 Tax=Lineus longissimus TaxID=88925 RepID=UPI002B4E4E7B
MKSLEHKPLLLHNCLFDFDFNTVYRRAAKRHITGSERYTMGCIQSCTENSNHARRTAQQQYAVNQQFQAQAPAETIDETLPPLVVKNETTNLNRGILQGKVITVTESAGLLSTLKDPEAEPLVFMVPVDNNLLLVKVKIVHLDCCFNKTVWCYSTVGMERVGQQELVFTLEYMNADTVIPRDMFDFFRLVFGEAIKGNIVHHLGFTHLGGASFLGSIDHIGFLYTQPSFQCVKKLMLPAAPKIPLFLILVHRAEIPILRNIPLRLMTRLGLKDRYYPCSLVSKRFRDPVFIGVTNTTLSMFCDFENFTYGFPFVPQSSVLIEEDEKVTVSLPIDKYHRVLDILSKFCSTPGGVLPIGADFHLQADSHLTVIQTATGYTPTGISKILDNPEGGRRQTGATFIVFIGHSPDGYDVQSRIFEDGIIVFLKPEVMSDLTEALQNHKSYTLTCDMFDKPEGGLHSGKTIEVQWTQPRTYIDDIMQVSGCHIHENSNSNGLTSEDLANIGFEVPDF